MPSAPRKRPPRSDCRRCTSYDPWSRWCSAVEATVTQPTAGRCSAYDGPPIDDEPTTKET